MKTAPSQEQKRVLKRIQEGAPCSQGFLLHDPLPLINQQKIHKQIWGNLLERGLVEPYLDLPEHKIRWRLTAQGRLAITDFRKKKGK